MAAGQLAMSYESFFELYNQLARSVFYDRVHQETIYGPNEYQIISTHLHLVARQKKCVVLRLYIYTFMM
jgi:hypothetical protein